jgi:hypothetical protein
LFIFSSNGSSVALASRLLMSIVVDLIDSSGAAGLRFSYVLAADGALSCQAAHEQLERFVVQRPMLRKRSGGPSLKASIEQGLVRI